METAAHAVIGKLCPKEKEICCSPQDIVAAIEGRHYVPLAHCAVMAIFSSKLTASEKLFYFLVDCYAAIEFSQTGNRTAEFSAKQWANWIGCSERYIFKLQKSLEQQGYLLVTRSKDCDNWDEKNILCPIMPKANFNKCLAVPSRHNTKATVVPTENRNYRAYLDQTKLFIPFSFDLVKLLLKQKLSAQQKISWLYFYLRRHLAIRSSDGFQQNTYFTLTPTELSEQLSIAKSSAIQTMSALEQHHYLTRHQLKVTDQNKDSRRLKRQVWRVDIGFPKSQLTPLINQRPNVQKVHTQKFDSQAQGSKSSHQYIKDLPIKKHNIKNISECTQITVSEKTPASVRDVFEKKDFSEVELNQARDIVKQFKSRLDKYLQLPEEIQQRCKPDDIFSLDQKMFVTCIAKYLANIPDACDSCYLLQFLKDCWEDLPENLAECQAQEMLVYKSWWLKSQKVIEEPAVPLDKPALTVEPVKQKLEQAREILGPKLARIARNYAVNLHKAGYCRGKLEGHDTKSLTEQLLYFAAFTQFDKIRTNSFEAQVLAKLNFAYGAIKYGSWSCPSGLLNLHVLQRR